MTDIVNAPIVDVSAYGVPVRVVAVKWPGNWIIRGIYCFESVEQVAAKVRPFVAIVPPEELEWTTHRYSLPGYLVYGTGDLPRWGWPDTGVFLFPHSGGDVYRGPARRLAR
jgi:hypothetical protein